MKFEERWQMAKQSNITIVGRLVICTSIIFFIIRYIIWITVIIKTVEETTSGIIGLVVLTLLLSLLALLIGGVIIFVLGLAIFWVINDYMYDWDDVIDFIVTAYKLLFGDYEGKYDFLRGNK